MHVSKALLVAAGLLGSTVLAAPGAPDHRAQDTVVERDAQAEPPAENPILPSLLGPLLAPIPSFLSSLLTPVTTRVPIPVVATTVRVPTLATTVRVPTPATTARASSLVTVSATAPTLVAYTTLFSPFPAFPAVVSVLQSIFATNPAIATASALVVPVSIIPSAFVSTRVPTSLSVPTLVPSSASLRTVGLPSLALPSSLLKSLATPSIVLPSSLPRSIATPSISLPSISLPSGLVTSIPPITFSGPSLTTLLSALPPTYTGSLTSAISVGRPEDCPVSYVTVTQFATQTLYVGHPLAPNATLSAPFIIPLLNATSRPVNITLPLFTGNVTGGPFPTLNLSSLPGLPVTLRPLPNLTLPTFPSLNITALLPTGRPNLTATLPLPLLNLTTRSRSSMQFSTLPLPTFSLPSLSLPTFSLPVVSPSIPTRSTSLVIATTVTPISTAAFSTSFALPSVTLPLVGTLGPAAPTGRPSTQNIHCGIHGAPIGDYYLATYAWNKRDVPVTLEGCYQFCNNVWGFTEGCQSFNFYLEPGLGAPRCDLYAGSVAYEVASIAAYSPYTWFDLGCGDPTQWIAGNPGGPRQ